MTLNCIEYSANLDIGGHRSLVEVARAYAEEYISTQEAYWAIGSET